jgi:hypothetical protein
MPQFGTFYVATQLVVFEITSAYVGGRPLFTATLSADPRVFVSARHPEAAALQLQALVSRLVPAAQAAVG